MRQDGPPDLQVLAQCRAGLSPLKCRTLRHGAASPADPVVYCCAARGGWYVHRTDSRWKMARLYHADLAELAWARYDKVMALASVLGTDGQRPGAGAEEQLDNRPNPRAREAYAFFQHGAAELRGGLSMAGGV